MTVRMSVVANRRKVRRCVLLGSPLTPSGHSVNRGASEDRAPTLHRVSADSAVRGDLTPRSILVVEDDSLTRMLLAEAISTAGFTTYSAATGSEAQRLFAAKDPDGVVLDVDLGHGLNGFDLCDAFVKHNPAIAVVFLTQLPDSRFMSRNPKSLPRTAAYLRKDQLSDKSLLIDALDAALRGDVPTEFHHDRHAQRPLSGLSRTQLDVMIMVSRGMTTSEIARTRGTNARTVQKVIIRSLEIMQIDATLDQSVRVRAVRDFLTAFDAATPAN